MVIVLSVALSEVHLQAFCFVNAQIQLSSMSSQFGQTSESLKAYLSILLLSFTVGSSCVMCRLLILGFPHCSWSASRSVVDGCETRQDIVRQ